GLPIHEENWHLTEWSRILVRGPLVHGDAVVLERSIREVEQLAGDLHESTAREVRELVGGHGCEQLDCGDGQRGGVYIGREGGEKVEGRPQGRE
ncbi:hypothetical protein PMAYCL1PPCAC_30855, partial [Pristionchus mayeri]